jgi:site-specific DNA-methyltransferase (adenine-specific)
MPNALYYGDNLEILRDHIADESVDLIYLDPPFNSQATYNVLFRAPTGEQSQAQIAAFEDTWHWNQAAEEAFDQVMQSGNTDAAEMLRAMRSFLRENDVMAYLSMMAVRLLQLRRTLKPTGSLYLHCDSTAGHYLKILLDSIFGIRNFRNEIVWKRTSTHSDSKTWSRVADSIYFYTTDRHFVWNTPRDPHTTEYKTTKYRYREPDGRIYRLHDMTSPNPRPNMMYNWKGFPSPAKGWRFSLETMQRLHDAGRIQYPVRPDGSFDLSKRPQIKRYLESMAGGGVMGTIWTDIAPINSQALERLGYPTQKPLTLLAKDTRGFKQSWRCSARSFLRLRHGGSRSPKARPALDRDRHHAPSHLPDRETAERCLSRHRLRSPRHAQRSGRRPSARRRGQIPIPVVGRLAGQRRAIRRQEARRHRAAAGATW